MKQQWKPIETAPKINGKEILAWDAHYKRVERAQWDDGHAALRNPRNKGHWRRGGSVVQASHWMPLPEPPKP
jgi:hypothetical protein